MSINFKMSGDNRDEVLSEMGQAVYRALETCGLMAESYAKEALTSQGAVDTGALRNSVSHTVADKTMYVGTNQEYAPYIEYGTGINYAGGRRTSWVYQDRNGDFHKTNGMKARPYIKPAVADHVNEYQQVITQELKS